MKKISSFLNLETCILMEGLFKFHINNLSTFFSMIETIFFDNNNIVKYKHPGSRYKGFVPVYRLWGCQLITRLMNIQGYIFSRIPPPHKMIFDHLEEK